LTGFQDALAHTGQYILHSSVYAQGIFVSH